MSSIKKFMTYLEQNNNGKYMYYIYVEKNGSSLTFCAYY